MDKHFRQAEHNLKLQKEIENNFPDQYVDWEVTLIFYATVHHVDALLEQWGRRPNSHEERFSLLRNNDHCSVPETIYFQLRDSYLNSRKSRYSCFGTEAGFVKQLQDMKKACFENMNEIKEFVESNLD